jgi:hypothetical protein
MRRLLLTRRPPAGQESLRTGKPDSPECQTNHLVSQKTAVASGYRHKQEAPKDGSSTGQSGGSQGKTRLRSETSANDETKPNVENGPEEVVA